MVVSARVSRRQVLASGVAAALAAMFGCAAPSRTPSHAPFRSVPISRDDTLVVPDGYRADVLFAWGDPVGSQQGSPAFRIDASNSADEQALQAGMHHDGMQYYPLPYGSSSPSRGLLAINHEYLSVGLLFADGGEGWNAAKVAKAIAASGVSVIEVERTARGWSVVRPSRYARRITADTPCAIGGPAAGSDLMKTARDPSGTEARGTFAGCAHGWTPWGTYLTCEENFQDRFVMAGTQSEIMKRDLIPSKSWARWEAADERFDLGKHPNESHRFGWVVEIDPYEPASKPVKRTALGRCCHESATPSLAPDGRLAIYTGDDKAFEYIYKFVSRDRVDTANRAANATLLDNGVLYAAKFTADGSGEWLPLVHGERGLTAARGFRDQAEVLVKTRMAADVLGATKMDRPEWIAVNERTREVVATLTSNTERGAPGRPAPDAVNPRAGNVAGHLVRWREANDDPTSLTFRWDILALAGDPAATDASVKGSFEGDAFANPDGVRFDPSGRLWIMTDVSPTRLNKGEFQRFGNNQLLVVDPSTGAFRRFLTGPVGCEITGLVFTPDGRTAFVNVQHPGEIGGESNDPRNPRAHSNWPDFHPQGRPRSATVVIQRSDGGTI